MPRLITFALVMIAVLLAAVAGEPNSRVAAQATPRLVVFEAFMRPT